ncbi:MAG: site-specific integrase, partial [Actinobacteria bacterium]|nr:site-specific integrase [Actinomycetota bacterium]
MSATALRALPSPDQQPYSWPAVLRAALREEFQVDVYRPRPGDRVLFGPTCAVAGCPGRGANRSLGLKAKGANHSTGTMFRGYICLAHVAMWRRDGEPPIDAWVQHAARARRGQVVPDRCTARGCRRSVYQHGFCGAHKHRFVFVNHKLSREAIIPITERLLNQIRAQQRDLDERFGEQRPPYLLPAVRANAGGQRPLTWGTLSRRLTRWMSDCDIRDATGVPVRVTLHQFRHTMATRMINNDVSLPAVQRMLDHDSPEMTARYARIKDQTLRREWERYQDRINIQGDVIRLDPDGPLSDASWAKENLARAKQTLPNGYCGLPLQQTCPHPNACLT